MTITVSTADPRSCKALALLEGADQWLKIRRKSDGARFYVIPGSAGHVYWTNCGECSCPDSQQRQVECKHITAVKLHVAKVQAERPARRSSPLADAEPLFCAACHTLSTEPMPIGSRRTRTHARTVARSSCERSRERRSRSPPARRLASPPRVRRRSRSSGLRDGFDGLAELDRARLALELGELADRYAPRRPRPAA